MYRRSIQPTLATLLIVIINIYFQFRTGINDPKFGDSQQYLLSARAIFNGEEYPRILEGWPFFRAPGYPFLVSTLWKISSYESIVTLKLFNSICIGIMGLGIYLLARKNLSQKCAIAALVLSTLNPFVFLQSLEVSTESVTTTLFVLFIVLLTSKDFRAKGLFLGLINIALIAIRPEFLFISTISVIIYYLFLEINPKKIIIPILLIAVSINFWGDENKRATGNYIPLTNATSFQLWLGSTETIYKNYPLRFQNSTNFSTAQYNQFVAEVDQVKKRYSFKESVTDIPRQSNAWFTEYQNNVNKNKLEYLKNILIKSTIFWRPFLNPSSYGLSLVLISLIILLPFTVFSFLGYLIALRQKIFYREAIILFFCLGLLTIIHALQMPDFRYRVPIQMPIMSLFIVFFFCNSRKWFRQERSSLNFHTQVK
jgi:hypothetical protein